MPSSLYSAEVQDTMKATPQVVNSANGTKIPYPFPSPADWRDHWIYFLLVDRFNNPSSPPMPDECPCGDYQGGNFEGIKQKLPYLKEMGVGAIWISPVLMNPQWFKPYWGGYGTMDFTRIEPRFCSDPQRALADPQIAADEFRSLVDEAHALGIYVILDIVLNHAADAFAYATHGDMAPWEPDSARKYPIHWRDEQGVARQDWTDIATVNNVPPLAGIWPRELQRNEYFRRQGGSNDFGDFGRMRELVTDYRDEGSSIFPVRNYLILAYQYLIAAFDLDGYRIDTLMYVEAEFARTFGNAMREYALSIGKKNFFTFGEVWKDDEEDKIAEFVGRNTQKDHEFTGIDAAIDFPLRKRLIGVIKGYMPPRELAEHAETRKRILKTIVSSHGDAGLHYVTFLDNHDLNERFHVQAAAKQTVQALTCLMTLQGIPCIYYGTELGLENAHLHGDRREFSREALWGLPGAFDTGHPLFTLIRDLSLLRMQQPALRYGRQYFRQCSGDGIHFNYSEYKGGVLAYSRILNNQELLVVGNTDATRSIPIKIIVDANLHSDGKEWKIIFPLNRINEVAGITLTSSNIRAVELIIEPMDVVVLI